jgi:hypothetical protein
MKRRSMDAVGAGFWRPVLSPVPPSRSCRTWRRACGRRGHVGPCRTFRRGRAKQADRAALRVAHRHRRDPRHPRHLHRAVGARRAVVDARHRRQLGHLAPLPRRGRGHARRRPRPAPLGAHASARARDRRPHPAASFPGASRRTRPRTLALPPPVQQTPTAQLRRRPATQQPSLTPPWPAQLAATTTRERGPPDRHMSSVTGKNALQIERLWPVRTPVIRAFPGFSRFDRPFLSGAKDRRVRNGARRAITSGRRLDGETGARRGVHSVDFPSSRTVSTDRSETRDRHRLRHPRTDPRQLRGRGHADQDGTARQITLGDSALISAQGGRPLTLVATDEIRGQRLRPEHRPVRGQRGGRTWS